MKAIALQFLILITQWYSTRQITSQENLLSITFSRNVAIRFASFEIKLDYVSIEDVRGCIIMTMNEVEIVRQADSKAFLVNGLMITDPDAVEFLDSLDETTRLEVVSTAMQFGILALRDLGTVSKVDWIDKRFQSFEVEVKDAFDDAKRKLEDYLGERGELQRAFSDVDSPIRSVLDPYTEGSPFWDLRIELEKEIRDVRDVILKEAGRGEEAAVGTRKGVKFEEELYDFLQPICSRMGDNIKRIGTKKVGGRKVGDLLIEVNEKYLQNPLRIVIEA